jgi:hypothetical protein
MLTQNGEPASSRTPGLVPERLHGCGRPGDDRKKYDDDVPKLALARSLPVLVLALFASAQTNPHVTGFFTNMMLVADSGDVVGMEVWVVYARGEYWATVQLADGFPQPPGVVHAEVFGPKISFEVPDPGPNSNGNGPKFRFTGEISAAGLTGTFRQQKVLLRRTKSYWQ